MYTTISIHVHVKLNTHTHTPFCLLFQRLVQMMWVSLPYWDGWKLADIGNKQRRPMISTGHTSHLKGQAIPSGPPAEAISYLLYTRGLLHPPSFQTEHGEFGNFVIYPLGYGGSSCCCWGRDSHRGHREQCWVGVSLDWYCCWKMRCDGNCDVWSDERWLGRETSWRRGQK